MGVLLAFVILPFWGWMFYDCAKREYNRTEWCLALIVLNIIGALYYFLVRWLPRHSKTILHRYNQWAYRDRLRELKADAKHLGKAPQFFRLGEAYLEMGQPNQALAAYQQAIEVEPRNRQALWEASSLFIQKKEWSQAKALLEDLLKISPNFKYGDASLAYAKVLLNLEPAQAQAHLDQHLQTWHHPEAYMLLAELCQKKQEIDQARELLEKMIAQVKDSPAFHYRKHKHFVVQGQKLLKSMV